MGKFPKKNPPSEIEKEVEKGGGGYENGRWVDLCQDTVQWRTLLNLRILSTTVAITKGLCRKVLFTIGGCIQKFPDWPPGARTANGTALCHYMKFYRYFVNQSSEFCCHNPLCCFSTSSTKGKPIFRYRLSLETFGYALVWYREET
jgi:hypothetical protein